MSVDVVSAMKALALRHGIQKLVLFGSRARGDSRRDSDYDFAVFCPGFSDLDVARLRTEVEEIDTLHVIDLVVIRDKRAVDPCFLSAIDSEGKTIHE